MQFDQPTNEPAREPRNLLNHSDFSSLDDSLGSTKTVQTSQPRLRLRSRRQYPVIANRQLLAMILLLIGVLYAMYEAGKPERWYWLVPPTESDELPMPMMHIAPSTRDSTLTAKTKSSSVDPGLHDSPTADTGLENSSTGNSSSISLLDSNQAQDPDFTANLDGRPNGELAYPKAALDFWQNWLRRASSKQRNDLYFILKRIRHQQPCPQLQQSSVSELIDKIKQQREADHEQRLSKLSFAPSSQRQQLTNELFESQQVWQLFELPALQAFASEAETTEEQRQQIDRLQLALDATIFHFVRDLTAQGWEGDSPAWGRMWERIVAGDIGQAIRVNHLELTSQPSFYRGKTVAASGSVQAARREPLTVRELGIEELYVLVVRPNDSRVSPYFVYSLELPDGFPIVGDQYVKMNQPIDFQGHFFKIRTYPDTQNKVQNAPMILANSIHPIAEVSIPLDTRQSSANLARPLTTGLILLPLLAIFIAWWLFRITNIVRFKPGKNRTAEIHRQLDGLSQNPDIKTDRERIDELYH